MVDLVFDGGEEGGGGEKGGFSRGTGGFWERG